jgi:hypothetical protein
MYLIPENIRIKYFSYEIIYFSFNEVRNFKILLYKELYEIVYLN